MGTFAGELEPAGIKLNPSKCALWLPVLEGASPAEVQRWQERLQPWPLSAHGVLLLGSAAQGEFECLLGPMGFGIQPVDRRLAQCSRLLESIAELSAFLAALRSAPSPMGVAGPLVVPRSRRYQLRS